MRILIMTSGWPSEKRPCDGVFVFRQVEALRRLNLDVNILDFRGRCNPITYFNVYVRMRHALRKCRYDLIHAHYGQAGFLAVLQRKVPVVVTLHGTELFDLGRKNILSKIKGYLFNFISWIAVRNAKQVIVVSERMADVLTWQRSHVVPMSIDLSLFSPMSKEGARKSLYWPPGERVVLFVADPDNPIKRYGLAWEAVALAARTVQNVKLRVCWNKPQDQVPVYMNASDVLLVTSSHEGGPLIVPEALACGLPVVSVDAGHVRQWIDSVEGCVLCENDRSETIAAGLIQVFERGRRVDRRATMLSLNERDIAKMVVNVYKLALKNNYANLKQPLD